jgi:uncharacterized protein (TIGR04222 family)
MDKLLLGILAMLVIVVISNPIANPIANMHGPLFLLFYAFVIGVTLLVCRLSLQRDLTANLPLPLIPTNPDPLEIAYLRGGENEVTRLVVLDLIQRGYLEIDRQKIKQSINRPNVNILTSLERDVLDKFLSPRKANQIFESQLPGKVKQHCTVYEQRLQNEQLLSSDKASSVARRIAWKGGLIILGLGSYKLIIAAVNGRSNVMFLIIMAIISIIILMNVCKVPRQSDRGKAYLQALQQTFEQLKNQVSNTTSNAGDLNNVLLPVAVFGVSILAASPFAEFEKLFHISAATANGGVSGGCGSSCGGGGGGGCGGCGGCGG